MLSGCVFTFRLSLVFALALHIEWTGDEACPLLKLNINTKQFFGLLGQLIKL